MVLQQESVSVELVRRAIEVLLCSFQASLAQFDRLSSITPSREEVKDFLRISSEDVLAKIFPEVDQVRNDLNSALDALINSVTRASTAFTNVIKSILEASLRELAESPRLELPEQEIKEYVLDELVEVPLTVARVFSRLIGSVQRSRSFSSALAAAMRLSENISMSHTVSIKSGEEFILKVWGELADRGFGLEPCALEKIDRVSDLFKDLGRVLDRGEYVVEIRDLIAGMDERGLSMKSYESLSQLLLSGFIELKECEGALCMYLKEHLLALHSLKQRHSLDLTNEVVRKYIDVVFVNSAFLEYEVYSALIRLGVPALPRLHILTREDPQEPPCEVDVVAALRDGLWVVEVTTRRLLDKNKLYKLEVARQVLNARRVMIVCDRPEEVERFVHDNGFEDYECYSFSEWASGRMLK